MLENKMAMSPLHRGYKLCTNLHLIMFITIHNNKQEDLSDLITELQSQCSAHSKAVLDDSLITVDTTSLDQHKLYYCTISRSRCEICDDVIV